MSRPVPATWLPTLAVVLVEHPHVNGVGISSALELGVSSA